MLQTPLFILEMFKKYSNQKESDLVVEEGAHRVLCS